MVYPGPRVIIDLIGRAFGSEQSSEIIHVIHDTNSRNRREHKPLKLLRSPSSRDLRGTPAQQYLYSAGVPFTSASHLNTRIAKQPLIPAQRIQLSDPNPFLHTKSGRTLALNHAPLKPPSIFFLHKCMFRVYTGLHGARQRAGPSNLG
jgi:hypothetical protein